MFQSDSADDNALFSALQHLRHNKHKVVLFHVVDTKTELKFDFDNTPRKFIDGDWRNRCFSDNVKEEYEKQAALYFKRS
jgi:hypothetical protein